MAGVYDTFLGPQNLAVTMKLLLYTVLMIALPIGTYFFLLHIVFGGNKNMVGWSGAGAIFMCNVVIVSYVVMAWREDDEGFEQEDTDDGTEDTPVILNQRKMSAHSTDRKNVPKRTYAEKKME